MDRALSGATIAGQSGPRSNGNEGGLRISKNLQHNCSLTIRIFSVISRALMGVGSYPSAEGAVGVFYSHSWLDIFLVSSPKFLQILRHHVYNAHMFIKRHNWQTT